MGSRFGFSKSGVTWAVLKQVGNVPCAKERFARPAISTEKISAHDFMSDVGIKSIGEDFGGIERRRFLTYVPTRV